MPLSSIEPRGAFRPPASAPNSVPQARVRKVVRRLLVADVARLEAPSKPTNTSWDAPMGHKNLWSSLTALGGTILSATRSTLRLRNSAECEVNSEPGGKKGWASPAEQALQLIRDARLGAEEI